VLHQARFCLFTLLSLLAINAPAGNNVYGPPDSDGPVVVDMGFLLSNITAISEEDETFDFEAVISMHWQDSRLAYDPDLTGYDELYYQGAFQFNEVFSGWWPQIILTNEAGRFDREGVMLRITPQGDVYYTEDIDAIAKSHLKLRQYPFDRQQFLAIFEVLGFDKEEVILRADPTTSGVWEDAAHKVQVPQWREPQLSTSVVEYDPVYIVGDKDPITAFKVQIEISRDPFYTLRLVGLPVMIFVILSWSVFWMDRSSVGDRMDISFIGILTVVAYQIMFSENLPKISYLTVMMSFMIISFLMMCATVAVNLKVAGLDNSGRFEEGDRVDRYCRLLFPLVYFGSTAVVGWTIYQTA
jgi:hypothetical protein